MNRPSFIVGLTLLLLSSMRAIADEPKQEAEVTTIPLDQIWGYNLPGTRDIAGIPLPETDPQQGVIGRTDAMFRRQREHDIEQWRRALTAKPPTERALPAFVLPRQPDFYTLQKASNYVAGMMRHGYENRGIESETFRAGEDMTLVFFSHPASYYVRLKKVEWQRNEIKVHYQFEPHLSAEVTVHFALIPLGKLPAGEYEVRFEQIPMEQKYREASFEPVHPEAFHIICRPFSFMIWEPRPPNDESPTQDATLIPLEQIWAYDMPGSRDIRELEPKRNVRNLSHKEYIHGSLVNQIVVLLSKMPKQGEKARPGFVVETKGKEALKNAHAVFLDRHKNKAEPETWLPKDTDLSLVFFTHATGWRVRINSVKRSPTLITVKYQFVDRHIGTGRFALIPVGKLPKGSVQVTFEQMPPVDDSGKPSIPKSGLERFVCDSFSFEVR